MQYLSVQQTMDPLSGREIQNRDDSETAANVSVQKREKFRVERMLFSLLYSVLSLFAYVCFCSIVVVNLVLKQTMCGMVWCLFERMIKISSASVM